MASRIWGFSGTLHFSVINSPIRGFYTTVLSHVYSSISNIMSEELSVVWGIFRCMTEKAVTSIRVDRELLDELDVRVEASRYDHRTAYLASLIRQHVNDEQALDYSDREAMECSIEQIVKANELINEATDRLSNMSGIEESIEE